MLLRRNGTKIQWGLWGREVYRTGAALKRSVRGKNNLHQKDLESSGSRGPDLADINVKSCAYVHKICCTKPGCRRQTALDKRF